ncbi:hypothetical protein ACWEO6_33820, partial [Streptomyces sp. NPDC004291]
MEWAKVQYGISRAGAVDALPAARPKIDWEQLRQVEKGRRSPLTARRAAVEDEDGAGVGPAGEKGRPRKGAETIVPTVWRGFSDPYGSWKIIW